MERVSNQIVEPAINAASTAAIVQNAQAAARAPRTTGFDDGTAFGRDW